VFSVVSSVWRWRRLVKQLAVRELRSRYAGSVLGGAWAVLEPVVQFALYFTVFSYFLGMRLEGRTGVGSYALYLVSGLVPFQMLQECLLRAAGFARSQSSLVRHVNVPLEVLLAGAILATVARHALSLALVTVAAIAIGTVTWAAMPATAAGLALLIVGMVGLSLALVPAGAFIPDLVQVVGTATTVLFFLTPIVYPVSAVPASAAHWMKYNPLVGVFDAIRAGFLGSTVSLLPLVLAASMAAAALFAGTLMFSLRAGAVRDVV
jgi:lipopolysaccharide transport system permease protein